MALIGISGKIGSGKDTAGMIIKGLADGRSIDTINNDIVELGFVDYPDSIYQTKKFADKLKDIVCLLIGCTRQQLEDRDFKETELGEEWAVILEAGPNGKVLRPIFDGFEGMSDGITNYTKYLLTPRKMLQLLGTEAGRMVIHPNIWVNALFSDYQNDVNWVVTDVRFPNEADAIKAKGGKLIRLVRNSDTPMTDEELAIAQHPSETSLDDYQGFDALIENDGTYLDLIEKLSTLGYE